MTQLLFSRYCLTRRDTYFFRLFTTFTSIFNETSVYFVRVQVPPPPSVDVVFFYIFGIGMFSVDMRLYIEHVNGCVDCVNNMYLDRVCKVPVRTI